MKLKLKQNEEIIRAMEKEIESLKSERNYILDRETILRVDSEKKHLDD
jgi:hypothetical protein